MNKKANTIIFLLAATVFNIIVTMICFFAMFFLFSRFLLPVMPEETIAWALPVLFALSIVGGVLVYRAAVKLMQKKVDVEKYFDPIFKRR